MPEPGRPERLVRWFDETYPRSCHDLAPSGTKAGRAVARCIKRLARTEVLPGDGDLLTFIAKEGAGGAVFYEAHGRRVPKANLVLWYATKDAALILFRVTHAGEAPR